MRNTYRYEDNVAQIIKPYSGEWVTLSSDKKQVLGHSKKMETALSQAEKKGEGRPFLIKAPDSNTTAFIYWATLLFPILKLLFLLKANSQKKPYIVRL